MELLFLLFLSKTVCANAKTPYLCRLLYFFLCLPKLSLFEIALISLFECLKPFHYGHAMGSQQWSAGTHLALLETKQNLTQECKSYL
jgi:hypothetical protein